MQSRPRLLKPTEVADVLGVSVMTLARHRAQGTGLAYVSLGPRTIRYSEDDIRAFLEAGRRAPVQAA